MKERIDWYLFFSWLTSAHYIHEPPGNVLLKAHREDKPWMMLLTMTRTQCRTNKKCRIDTLIILRSWQFHFWSMVVFAFDDYVLCIQFSAECVNLNMQSSMFLKWIFTNNLTHKQMICMDIGFLSYSHWTVNISTHFSVKTNYNSFYLIFQNFRKVIPIITCHCILFSIYRQARLLKLAWQHARHWEHAAMLTSWLLRSMTFTMFTISL